MYILVTDKGDLELRDSDNMRAFSIVLEAQSAPVSGLTAIGAQAEDANHYWLDANAVAELSGRIKDQQWVQDFRAMLANVAPYGYYDSSKNLVKAHVEAIDA
jgi:hypothetical protein